MHPLQVYLLSHAGDHAQAVERREELQRPGTLRNGVPQREEFRVSNIWQHVS